MGWTSQAKGGGDGEVSTWKSSLGRDSAEREREREECFAHFASLCCSDFLCFSTCKEYQTHPPRLTHTHTHARSRQTQDGNYEQCAAGRQQRERNDLQKENIRCSRSHLTPLPETRKDRTASVSRQIERRLRSRAVNADC